MGTKYPGVVVSAYNVSPPSDDGAITDANKVKWSYHKTKIGDPLNTAIAAINTALVAAFDASALAKSSNYTILVSDHGKTIETTGTTTLLLPDAAGVGTGYFVKTINVGVAIVTVGRVTSGNTINGVAQNLTLNPGESAAFVINAALNGYLTNSLPSASSQWGGTAGGTANALTISVTPAITTYVSGQTFRFFSGGANTGATTLAVNGLAAYPILKEGSAALTGGEIQGTLIQVTYGANNFYLHRTGGVSLSDVLHTTGAESKSGLLTFNNDNLKINGASPRLDLKATDQTLPAGLWALQLFGSNQIRLLRNTAAGGDFSTNDSPFIVNPTGDAAFLGKVTAVDATASTHLVTKSQLDAKVYGGFVANTGTASFTYGPSGWTVSRTSAGVTQVTHNLGTTNYAVVATIWSSSARLIHVTARASNSFDITTTTTGGSGSDESYHFVLARN